MDQEIFKAYDVRGKVGTQLNNDVVERIGRAFADWLPTKGPVAVGHDMRPDSAELAEAFAKGLTEQGRDVYYVGLITSDMVYYAVGEWKLAGGATITASHNPGKDNGIKLYRDQVIAVGLDSGLDEIRDAATANQFSIADKPGVVTERKIIDEWIKHCLKFAPNLKPFSIAIDNGNGAAGVVLPHLLPKLPIKAEVLYMEPDGTFPNHEANPSKIENLQDLIAKVKQEKLDFGIAFDGDGDRAVLVDDLGRPVSGSDALTIGAKYFLDKQAGGVIVHEVRTGRSTQELVKKWGGVCVRTKAGRTNIAPAMREHKALFGGETSGHMFFSDNYYADSGLIGALVIMQAISDDGRKLSEIVDDYHLYPMIPETNFEVSADKRNIRERLIEEFSDGEIDELDGVTVNYPDGWINVRPSNTEPVLRLNAEATDQKRLVELVARVKSVIFG
ncbi:MAG: phosphomannomutase/phosphoglucomutase [Candidatus Nomurabacteria bacterium]|jgi:phosphomannomutase|nr:phosphomannomutase/phosphoglucomutase [Candidatus Nomurabacteria bacterium]